MLSKGLKRDQTLHFVLRRKNEKLQDSTPSDRVGAAVPGAAQPTRGSGCRTRAGDGRRNSSPASSAAKLLDPPGHIRSQPVDMT